MSTIDPDGLRATAAGFETEVANTVSTARSTLASGPAQSILGDNFTNVHVALASVYVEAYNFAQRDLQRKHDDAVEFRTRLVKTADDWEAAERHSTVKKH